jgi:hypothetical protein
MSQLRVDCLDFTFIPNHTIYAKGICSLAPGSVAITVVDLAAVLFPNLELIQI